MFSFKIKEKNTVQEYKRTVLGRVYFFLIGNPIMPIFTIIISITFIFSIVQIFKENNNGVEFFVETEFEQAIAHVRARGNLSISERDRLVMMVENEILLADSIDKEKMKKMAKMDKSMAHSHSNSVLLVPSEKGSIIWKFDNAVNIEIACNVPGHYDVGMIAKVNLD